MPTLKQQIGERVTAKRLLLGLTQYEAAKLMGPNWVQSQWADLERGRFVPKVITLKRLAKALQCSVADLIPDSGDI